MWIPTTRTPEGAFDYLLLFMLAALITAVLYLIAVSI